MLQDNNGSVTIKITSDFKMYRKMRIKKFIIITMQMMKNCGFGTY